MKIKAVCERTGLTDRAIRLYIDSGLLAPDKTENYAGRRSFDFSEGDIRRLDQIAALRAAGFSIAQIRELMTDPGAIARIVGEVKQKQREELEHGEKVLALLENLGEDIDSFDALADHLTDDKRAQPPAEDDRVRLRYLIARFFDGAYRNGALDGIIRALILVGFVLFGCYVKFDSGGAYLFSAGMWIDLLLVMIAAAIAVTSAVLLVRDKDAVNTAVKLFLSNLTLAAAVGAMFLVWLIARIILYPERPIPNYETIHIAELWIGFIGVSAVARAILLILYGKKVTK